MSFFQKNLKIINGFSRALPPARFFIQKPAAEIIGEFFWVSVSVSVVTLAVGAEAATKPAADGSHLCPAIARRVLFTGILRHLPALVFSISSLDSSEVVT